MIELQVHTRAIDQADEPEVFRRAEITANSVKDLPLVNQIFTLGIALDMIVTETEIISDEDPLLLLFRKFVRGLAGKVESVATEAARAQA